MWWLIVPVIACSVWLFTLRVILSRRNNTSYPDAPNLPEVSVVVAAKNEEKHITRLLESLSLQDYPADLLEIVIVNDNSTDRTPVAVSEFIESRRGMDTPPIRLIYNPFQGKKKAIRYGIEKSSGDVILTTDADCTVGPGWVRSHASWYTVAEPAKPGRRSSGEDAASMITGHSRGSGGSSDIVSMVLAPVVQRHSGGFWSLFGIYEFAALQAITEATAVAGHPVMCNAANMSFRRDIHLQNADKLHPDLASGDDMFLLQAVMRDGGAVRHDGRSAAAAETAAAVTAAALLRQRARWASKTFHYSDAVTITLAAATAACNAAVAAAAVAAFMNLQYLPLAAAMYTVKTIPDYLLIAGEMKKRGSRVKALPFILAEIIYPFWFVTVGILSLMPGSGRFGKR